MARNILVLFASITALNIDAMEFDNGRFRLKSPAYRFRRTSLDYHYHFDESESTHNTKRALAHEVVFDGLHPANTSGESDSSSMYAVDNTQAALDRRKRWRRGVDGRAVITQHFTERTVTPGGDISMQCSATGQRPPQFTWLRDGVALTTNTDARYAIGQLMTSSISVLSQLNISRVRVEDGGLYSCTARDGDSVASHENRLDVYGPPYIRSLPAIKVQSGDSINLRCPFYGYPISKIDWQHEGHTITSHPFQTRYKRRVHTKRRREAPTLNLNGVLSIPEVSKELNGQVYTCVVTSPSGEMARRAFDLQVVEAPVLEELLLGSNLQEGQIVNIYCNVRSGDLPIHFEWLKDGKRIPSSLKVAERNSELFSALVIKKVGLEHGGRYTCAAANQVARVEKTTELFIKVAPRWQQEPRNSSLLLGRAGAVACAASGYPLPQVHWMKKDGVLGTWQPVLELAGGGVLSAPNGTLLIEEVSLSDEGLYSCNVENGVGQPLSRTVWISVNKPVHFEAPSANVTTRAGRPATLECRPRGDDPVRVVWTRAGVVLEEGARLKISTSRPAGGGGGVSAVALSHADSGDAGVYQCRASNPYGGAVFVVHLTVLEPPTPPLDIRAESIRSRAVTLTWRDTIRTHVEYYTLQYAPGLYPAWGQAHALNVTRLTDDVHQSVELAPLRPAAAYSARVAAGHRADLSPYTAPVSFTTLEEAPSAPPSNVQADQTDNPGELIVRWSPPPKETVHGAIVGYHVRVTPQHSGIGDNDAKIIKVNHMNGKQETILSGLLKNVRYAVAVAAATVAGAGPYSIAVYQDTREGAPEQAPTSVECTAVSSSSLRVAWHPVPSGPGSVVIGYSVLYSTEEGAWQNLSSLHTEQYLQGLLKYTNYTIKVAGYSNFGVGPFSYPITCTTLEDVPGPPADIKVLVMSQTSMLVSWKRPDHPNGHILDYNVYVKSTSSSTPPNTYRWESGVNPGGRTLSLEATGLTPGRQYEVWVAARSAAGEGVPTRRVAHSTSSRLVAGVWSLGGSVALGAGSSVLLACACVGAPPPRTVWYHQGNIITYHPRYTRNHDDSLLINNIDQSLSGTYMCLAKNLYGSDSVEYNVIVLPLPDAPVLRATPYRDSLVVEWEQPNLSGNASYSQKISYSLTWKEANGPWQEALSSKSPNFLGTQRYTLSDLKCGTKYSLRITATNKVGTSQPAYLDISTLGGGPIPPQTADWLWSNATHIHIQLSGWDDNGCRITKWDVDYRRHGATTWIRAENRKPPSEWHTHYHSAGVPDVFSIGDLAPGSWYQVRVSAGSEAGAVASVFGYATKNEDGTEVGPPSGADVHTAVIAGSGALLAACAVGCCCALLRRRTDTEHFRESTATDKSDSGLTAHTSHTNLSHQVKDSAAQQNCNRIYSAPIHHLRNNSKHELYEISPYAQFAVGFRTFGRVDNQDPPRARHKCDTETSFQACSESDDSDSVSKSTLKSVPRKSCRTPHRR